jgi:O-antigen/teichoic acid export membrane protein
MSTNPSIPQNDREKRDDVAIEHVKRLHRPSLLKDPTILFDTSSTNDRLPSSMDISRTEENACNTLRQLPVVSFREDVFGETVSGREHVSIDQQLTWLIPAIADLEQIKKMSSFVQKDGYPFLIKQLMKNSGIYAIASCLSPLISLVLAPFLTYHLSRGDYGVLIVLGTTIALLTGLTQCGQGNAFFWAYHNVASSIQERRMILSTMILLLLAISLGVTIVIECAIDWISYVFLYGNAYDNVIRIAALVVFTQNMTIPTFSWLRVECRAGLFGVLSLCNLCINLGLTLFFVGILQWGISGALLAICCGYAAVIICSIPSMYRHLSWHFHWLVAKRLLAFGLSTVPGLLSVWILQLSDRYLLIYFGSLSETASYSVAYTLGNVMGPIIITPFSLAWYSAMYRIAQKRNAKDIFRLIFRWYGFLVLLIAFCVALFAKGVLEWFFPNGYSSAASIIPFIALSNVFYGIFEVFTVGVSLQGKHRLNLVGLPIAAILNVVCNIVLIPKYGVTGAACATLAAYIVLALIAYFVNQRIYPIHFEVGLFCLALCLGIIGYVGIVMWVRNQSSSMRWVGSDGIVCLYAGILIVLGKIPERNWLKK